MKSIKLLTLALISSLIFSSCSSDDAPVAVNEEEVITTIEVTLTNDDNADDEIQISQRDLDGDGSGEPIINGGTLAANTTYTGTIELWNELESPAERVTEEIEEEDDEHQFFFTTSIDGLEFDYEDLDENELPVGLTFSLTTGDAGTGTITVRLVHEPNKTDQSVINGDITNAGGTTEVDVNFPIAIE